MSRACLGKKVGVLNEPECKRGKKGCVFRAHQEMIKPLRGSEVELCHAV
eukprot:COSAG06_NODE_22075_length_734_cov_9.982677_1_plen_48_part_01